MRRITFFIVAILLLSSGCVTGDDTLTYFKPAAGLTCTSGSGDSAIVSQLTENSNEVISTYWWATPFTLAATTRVTSYKLKVNDNTVTDAGSIRVSIYSKNGGTGKPDTEVSNTVVTVATTSIPDNTMAEYTFTLSSPVNVSAGDYLIVPRGVSGDGDIIRTATGVGTPGWYSLDGSTWNSAGGEEVYFQLMGCQ
jgi:hypothetical protein